MIFIPIDHIRDIKPMTLQEIKNVRVLWLRTFTLLFGYFANSIVPNCKVHIAQSSILSCRICILKSWSPHCQLAKSISPYRGLPKWGSSYSHILKFMCNPMFNSFGLFKFLPKNLDYPWFFHLSHVAKAHTPLPSPPFLLLNFFFWLDGFLKLERACLQSGYTFLDTWLKDFGFAICRDL